MKYGKITELDLAAVKEYLRVDGEEEDLLISTFLISAKSFIQTYLRQSFDEFEELPEEFTIACLAIIAHWYETRAIATEKSGDEIAYMFAGLLDPHRKWN